MITGTLSLSFDQTLRSGTHPFAGIIKLRHTTIQTTNKILLKIMIKKVI